MANNITYKVLWIDDQVAFDPDFVEGYQIKEGVSKLSYS